MIRHLLFLIMVCFLSTFGATAATLDGSGTPSSLPTDANNPLIIPTTPTTTLPTGTTPAGSLPTGVSTSLGTLDPFAKKTRLAETCQDFDSIQGDVTGNNPAASLIQTFLRAFSSLQLAFNTRIADAAIGLGLILLTLFSLFYALRMLYPFTPYGQIAETYNQIFNLWGVAIVVFLIVLNPNFVPNNIIYPVFKSLINANFSLLQISSTMAYDATNGEAVTDPSCLGKSGGKAPLEQIIRGIVEQTTYAQGVSMGNLCISLAIVGFADPDDKDRCFEANKANSVIEACKDENVAKGYLNALCNIQVGAGFVGGLFNVARGIFDIVLNKFKGENDALAFMNVIIGMIFGFGLLMMNIYKYLMIGLYMLEAAMLPFILSAFWSLIAIIGIIPAGRGVIKIAFFAVLQGGATIIFLGIGLSLIAAIDTYVWFQFTQDPNMVASTLVTPDNFMYAWPLWMIFITTFAGINALKKARSMAGSVFKTGLDLDVADSLFNTFKGMVYFAADIAGDVFSAGGFSKVRRVVLR